MKPMIYWNVDNGTIMVHKYALWATVAAFALAVISAAGLAAVVVLT